jgi:hypothetical protein
MVALSLYSFITGRFHGRFLRPFVRDAQKRKWIPFLSAIAAPPNCFFRAIVYVIARICMFGRHIGTITDRETDAAVEMIQAQSRMKKRIHLRYCKSRTGQRTKKEPVETTL